MIPIRAAYCDCCGLSIGPQSGDECPRCDYPITLSKEERFLESAVHDLQRVAAHGGARITVTQLIQRYQTRLHLLQQFKQASAPVVERAKPVDVPVQPVVPTDKAKPVDAPMQPVVPITRSQSPKLPVAPARLQRAASQPAPEIVPSVHPPVTAAPAPQADQQRQAPIRVFSLKSFFADQTITIVAALGAFLILVGSLSFVATTTNLLLSFLILFGVHAVFGVTGVVSYRFGSFRLVAVIYTAIFALLVPLVGFSGYRLVSGQLIALAPPTLVAIAAAYAALVYGMLAIYQRFSPFGYLSVVSLALADLAVANAFHLGVWWWPAMLMLLALPALTSLIHRSNTTSLFAGERAALRIPVLLLMWTCVSICALGLISVFLYSINIDSIGHSSREVRFSITSMAILLLCWLTLYLWHTRRIQWTPLLPYLFLIATLASCYAFEFRQVGYALTLTATALLFHGLARFAASQFHSYGKLALHMEILALVLVGLVPFIAMPLVPVQILELEYAPTTLHVQATLETIAEISALIAGLALSISVMLSHTGLRRTLDGAQTWWRWLLLLCGFLLNYIVSMVVLSLKVEPMWCFLGLTLMLVASTVAVRWLVSAQWANPLDVLTLCAVAENLLLGLQPNDPDRIISLLLFFATLSYCVLLYQRRANWLFLPLVLALLAFPSLLQRPQVLLIISVLLPLVAAVVHRFITNRWNVGHTENAAQPSTKFALVWEWPLLVVALCSSLIISWTDIINPTSTIQSWLHIVFPVALEMATLALAWYIAAALTRVKWWLVVAACFAAAALLMPGNSFWILAWLAPVLAIVAFAISRFAGRVWAIPLYITSILAEVMAGIAAYNQGLVLAATGALLVFTLVIYLVSVAENEPEWMWTGSFFAIWSVYYSAQLGDLYRAPSVALAGAAIGVGIGCLKFIVPRFVQQEKTLRRFALPFYATAIAAAVLTGIYGTLAGSNKPFPTAIPDALFVYALVAYGVILFERRAQWLALVAGFGIWGVLLAGQTTAYYVAGIGFAAALLGIAFSRVMKLLDPAPTPTAYANGEFSWGWPWYISALVTAGLLGCWGLLPTVQPAAGFIEYSLLAFAVLAYIVGIVENVLVWSWVGVGLAIWSQSDATWRGDVYRLLTVALLCAALGLLTLVLDDFVPTLTTLVARRKRIEYVLPFYAVATAAGVLTGIFGTSQWNVNYPFYAAMPAALLLYALMAYGVSLLERRVEGQWLVAGFALWEIVLMAQTSTCYGLIYIGQPLQPGCSASLQNTFYDLVGSALVTGILGLLAGRFVRIVRRIAPGSSVASVRTQFAWNWSWYLASLVAIIITVGRSYPVEGLLPVAIVLGMLGALVVLTLVIMLMERAPELLIVPVILAAWIISQMRWTSWQQMVVAYTLLCVLAFASQFIWRLLPSATRLLPATRLHRVLGLGGQMLVVLACAAQRALFAATGWQAHVGPGSLGVLAALLLWYGLLQTKQASRRWSMYGAGLLFSLVVTWELIVLHLTHLDWLTLAPATYLVVVSPFLSRDEALPYHHRVGQLCSMIGAILLLLPTLWLSFSLDNLQPTLYLAGESLALLLLGIATRVRIFILSGAALVVVSAMHALFLPSLGIPPSLALAILGGTLLAIATGLSLARRRLQLAWIHWE